MLSSATKLQRKTTRNVLKRTLAASPIDRTPSSVPRNLQGDPQGILVMEDGSVHTGYVFGANRSIAGEVVFTTNMVGYPESMTDPSFAGQILNLTYPMIGNYGIPGKELDEHGLFKHFESNRIQAEALLISDYSHKHSHWNAAQSLSEWMQEYDVPGLYVVVIISSDSHLTHKISNTHTGTVSIRERLPRRFVNRVVCSERLS